jgi:dGTPase
VDERPKRAARGANERDRARVLHSSALRRLAAKTQVVQVDGDAAQLSPRTRLTHSLECAQIGRELGRLLGCDPDVVDAACLAHDLGHPPFGHNGEAALDALATPCGGFEGNAQTLRLLTRLEAKTFAPDGTPAGLNLTRATLDAVIKYPWPRGGGPPGSDPAKYCAFADDLPAFAWAREGAPAARPSFEAQVMDWADDIAYSVHDLEDGLLAGHVTLDGLRDPGQRREVCARTAAAYSDAGTAELGEVFAGLVALPFWPAGHDGGPRSLAACKNLTSELIGRFCRAAETATRAGHGTGPLTRYSADLVVPRQARLECALLKGVTAHYVMDGPGVAERRARQRDLIIALVESVRDGAPETLEPHLRPAYDHVRGDAGRLRVVVDQVASLTDTSALAWHRRLCRHSP